MFFEPSTSPDPEGPGEQWEGLDLSGAACEEPEEVAAARGQAAFDAPDSLDHLIEVADMMTMQAAQRLVGVNVLRREALADAARHGRVLSDVVERSVRLEIAAALRITEGEAARLLALGEALAERYPAVLDSFARARMTERHAELLVKELEMIEPEFREEILPSAIALAQTQPVGAFRRGLRSLVETMRAVTLGERHEEALKQRRVFVEPAADGMAWLMTLAPAVEVQAIFGRATTIAKALRSQEGETRTLDQIRADVIADLLIEGDTDGHPDEARGIRATVAVTVPALALLSGQLAPGEVATVEGVGPIPLARASELCGGAEGWMRILTHPETGIVLSVGRDQYRPPPGLRRLVKWRADRCMGPGCGIPASRCEIDHRIAWEHGGETSLQNLNPFCRGHHILKHHGGWTVRDIEGSYGAVEWISPAGRRYIVEPERRIPAFRAPVDGDAPF
ncbi:MAG: DUF222 domain-containing protein [Microbacterium sp.]